MAQKKKPARGAPAKATVKAKTAVKSAKTVAKAEAKPMKAAKVVAPKMAVKVEAKPKNKDAARTEQIAKAKVALVKESKQAEKPVTPVSEPKAKARKISIDVNPNEAVSALAQKWSTLYKKAEQIESKPYNMKASFEERTAIVHKVLGWGYILANRNDRLEVLFKDGIKYLISNYKP